jgi:hypothetical protein
MVGVQLESDGVAHGPGWNKQGGFFAEYFSRTLFEQVDRWIFTVNIVADFGGCHGGAHLRRWTRNGVATQIDAMGVRS